MKRQIEKRIKELNEEWNAKARALEAKYGRLIQELNALVQQDPPLQEEATTATPTKRRHKRKKRIFQGKDLSYWSKEKGIGVATLRNRLAAGWSMYKAVNTPLNQKLSVGLKAHHEQRKVKEEKWTTE